MNDGPQDGLYWKYVVLRAPNHIDPEDILEYQVVWMAETGEDIRPVLKETLEEPEGFLFVTKPESDHHARVALAAYAESCDEEMPELAAELRAILRDVRA